MKLSELLEKLDYTVVNGDENIDINNLIYDSRKVGKGDVFVCLKGFNSDGHNYAQQAIEKGAAAVVISDDIKIPSGITAVKVTDTRKALAYMSAAFFGYPAEHMTTIAVTGTKGKTTTACMIRAMLEYAGIKTGLIGTLGIMYGDKYIKTNNTTPESYEIQQAMRDMVDYGCTVFVTEASSLGLKWHRTDCIDFDYGVFTNFSHDHIGDSEHASMEEYFDCKCMLFRQCKTGIINIDDEKYENIIAQSTCNIETFGFSEKADFIALNDELIFNGNFLGVHFDTKGKTDIPFDVAIPGRFSVYNAIAAIAVCSHFGIDNKTMYEGLRNATVKGRVEPVQTDGDYILLIDYAHNALSMENVLTTLRSYNPGRLITMFGAGGNRPKVRRYEMGETSGRLSDLSVITADNSRFEEVNDIIDDILVGMKKTSGKYIVIPDRREAIKYCIDNAQSRDIIVLAGKGHEDYQEIKGVKYHFDEREVIADIYAERAKA
ncbi:MAG: UDP-N-acetylmuramoyl-L-alanyl-D-glutamate--2,6-diaminopimelate ligase [Acutalibacteraceae bacterium]